MTDDAIIHDRIMRRVHRIHLLSLLVRPVVVKAGMGLILLGLSFSLVSIADVLANMPGAFDVGAFFEFISNAFLHTEIAVKGIVIALVLLSFLMLRDVFTSVFHHPAIKAA